MNAFPKILMAALLVSTGVASGQTTGGPVTANFRDVDLTEIAKAVSTATGKKVVLDPRIHAQVTMVSPTQLSPAAFYDAFLSIVRIHGWLAQTKGNVVTILCDPKQGSSCPPIPL
jgi:general secretion pathway protein D